MKLSHKDGGWGWVIVVAALLNSFILDGVRYSYGLLYIEFLQEFKRGKGETSWIGSLMVGFINIGSIPASISVNRFGCRNVSIAGAIISTVGYIASIFGKNVQHLYVTFGVLGGLGFSFSILALNVMVMRWFDRRRSLAFGIAACGSGLGGIVFNPLSKLLIDLYGWRGTLLIEAGIILNGVVCGLVMKPFSGNMSCQTEEEKVKLVSENTRNYHGLDESNNKKLKKSLFRSALLKNPAFVMFSVTNLLVAFSYMIPFTYLPDMFVSVGLSRTEAAWLMSFIGIANTVFRPVAGWLGDKRWIRRTTLYAMAVGGCGLCTGLFPYVKTFDLLVSVCLLFGTVAAIWTVLVPVVLVDLFEEETIADSFGIMHFIAGIGSFLGPPMTGWMYDVWRQYDIPFIVAGCEFIAGGILVPFIVCLPSHHLRLAGPKR